jgi:uncharacterized membrane protein
MISFELGTLIDRPMKDVFAFVSDLNNGPKWQSQMVAVHQISSGSIGVGTTYKTTGELMGRRLEGKAEVTDYQPDSMFGFRMDAGPVQVRATISLKPAGTGTRFSLKGEGNPGGVFKLAEGALAKQIKSQMEANLARLKSVLEAS